MDRGREVHVVTASPRAHEESVPGVHVHYSAPKMTAICVGHLGHRRRVADQRILADGSARVANRSATYAVATVVLLGFGFVDLAGFARGRRKSV